MLLFFSLTPSKVWSILDSCLLSTRVFPSSLVPASDKGGRKIGLLTVPNQRLAVAFEPEKLEEQMVPNDWMQVQRRLRLHSVLS
ncbi:hypothetical protein MPTK1_3g04120 [Marchantia polymorpha subsp. ruderalis]|uniref:Uncharacterized protein n=2 Tax=Marchantia polymorpha TaxID=3197 RepID=A0AAF6AXA1_MARPO|nr:hypothetical protein MARPO_0022s0119 [Marchantia polymorpha]PTQ44020.1 hypothetical protein MARPO_0022s0119 [Marchantia polymorpha]BBN04384.1 hypothetical protein Mp_3g04120 [Marchantia polymorpha subsp. ruderalis]BBN04385.1 hypothetical protein Mp_3g04120 [Marchantia polymorpha subsp. ruderalis]|eukprot:PTQ44019.1 hypothetical protein MARPO_0022s0119 [Marchantia polymorpha]